MRALWDELSGSQTHPRPRRWALLSRPISKNELPGVGLSSVVRPCLGAASGSSPPEAANVLALLQHTRSLLVVVAVRFGVQLGGFLMMLGGMHMVTVRHIRMMRRLLVMAGFVMLGGLTMMFCSLLVMMRGFFVMLVDLVVVQILAVRRLLPGCCDTAASIAGLR